MTHLILFIIIGYRLYIITYISHCHISNINLCQNTKPFKDGAYCTVNCTLQYAMEYVWFLAPDILYMYTVASPLSVTGLVFTVCRVLTCFWDNVKKLETFQLCSLQTFNRCLFTHFVHAARANFLNLFAGGENTVCIFNPFFISTNMSLRI